MRQNRGKRPVVFVFLLLLGFLCVLPAVSHAAQASGNLPQPSDSYTVPPGTSVSGLLQDRKLTVF